MRAEEWTLKQPEVTVGLLAVRAWFGIVFAALAGFAAGASLSLARFAAAALVFLAKLAAARAVGLGLAGGHGVDPRADRSDGKGDDVESRLGDAAGQGHRQCEEKKCAHLQRHSSNALQAGERSADSSLTSDQVHSIISVMTEMAEHESQSKMAPAVERFVLHWGDMGGRWGVNRSVAQIHALLYLAERPLTAEDIADSLGMARSNVSNSLKELLGWKLIRRIPVMGDRRDHYEAETDLWEMLTRIAQGRKERELDPAASAIRACIAEAERDETVNPVARRRLEEMGRFVGEIERWYGQMLNVPPPKLMQLMKMGGKVVDLLRLGRRAKD